MLLFRNQVLTTLTILVLTPTASDLALGVNLAFMPGDAFFHSRLTRQSANELHFGDTSLLLSYDYPENSMTFGGYAGFSNLQIINVNSQMSRNLRILYDALRESIPMIVEIAVDSDGKKEQQELNGFHVFIYNRRTEWKEQLIGLKYNEHWMNLPATALDSPTRKQGFAAVAAIRYVSFYSSFKSVIQDWQYAPMYDPLGAKVPQEIAWGVSGPPINEPIETDAQEIQIIVLEEQDLDAYFEKEDGANFYSVSLVGIKRLTWKDGKLQSLDWSPETEDQGAETKEPAR